MPRFENTWTFGNTLTLVAMFLGGVGVYYETSAQVRVLTQIVSQYREDILDMREIGAQNDARIRALELGAGRIEEKLLAMSATLQRIEQLIAQKEGAR